MGSIKGKNIILCGYNWAGCKALEQLVNAGCNVFVCTHLPTPDIPDLTIYARDLGISATHESVNDVDLPFVPDLICSIYYRYIIKNHILNMVAGKAVNLHPSLLPKYRGCGSLTWAMINGESYAGYTYHYMSEGCDSGKVLLQKKIAIEPFDTQQNLYQRVMFYAMDDFMAAMNAAAEGVEGREQEGEPSYYKRGAPFNGEIDPSWNEQFVSRFIRAMKYPPYPYAKFSGVDIYSLDQFFSVKERTKRK